MLLEKRTVTGKIHVRTERGAEDCIHFVQFFACYVQRLTDGRRGQRNTALIVVYVAPFPNTRALDDPLVGRVDDRCKVVVCDDRFGYGTSPTENGASLRKV